MALPESRSKWWISGNANNEDKWKMARSAVEVANAKFGDDITLEGEEGSRSWPGS